MTQADKAQTFAALHQPGNPVILYNIWDAGSAKAIADAGAKAVATGSWSVAGAHGYADGEAVPLDLVVPIVDRIAVTVDLPLTVDFEGGYAVDPADVAANVTQILGAGAIGINFEDQVVGGAGLYAPDDQAARIRAIRAMADSKGVPLFINARTDLFLKEKDGAKHAELIEDALARAQSYKAAGANGFFVPGLVNPDLIRRVCDGAGLPVNVMMRGGAPSTRDLASLGVARISYGPGPFVQAMAELADRFKALDGI